MDTDVVIGVDVGAGQDYTLLNGVVVDPQRLRTLARRLEQAVQAGQVTDSKRVTDKRWDIWAVQP